MGEGRNKGERGLKKERERREEIGREKRERKKRERDEGLE